MMPNANPRIRASKQLKSSEIVSAKLDKLIAEALRRTAEAAATYARLSTLYKSHTYKLRAGIGAYVAPGTGNAMPFARIVSRAPYSKFVHDGTKQHPIVPRDRGDSPRQRKFLRFVKNGQVVFSRGVIHPGTKPRPFMTEARDKATPLFQRLVGEAFEQAFK